MLKNRIKSLISLIKDTEIEEIEVSSFWGAQKIRLSKKKTNQNTNIESVKSSVSEISIDSDKVRSKDVVDSDIVIALFVINVYFFHLQNAIVVHLLYLYLYISINHDNLNITYLI